MRTMTSVEGWTGWTDEELAGITAPTLIVMGDRDFTTNVPEGLVAHSAGPVGDDGWVVSEVWQSREAQEAFMGGRLGEALAAIGVPPPAQVIDTDAVSSTIQG